MKPEFMRLRRALAAVFAALLIAAGLVVLSPAASASAHDYDVRADCATGLSVNLTAYPSGTTVEVVIDKVTRTNATFGGSWVDSYAWDSSVGHEYTVAVDSPDDPSGSQNWSFSETKAVSACTSEAPKASLAVQPCTGESTPATLNLKRLVVGSDYVITIVSGEDQPAGTLPLRATTTNHSLRLHNFGPGDYYVAVSNVGGAVLTRTAPVTTNCASRVDSTPPNPQGPNPQGPLDTLAAPSIELQTDQCSAAGSGLGTLAARMSDLDDTKNYFVRIVDSAGATVAGGEDQTLTGVTSASVQFPGIVNAGTYTAQLLIDPGKQLTATSASATTTGACLPTLAMTGPGVLIPLGSVAALLLTLGGAVVTGRLRRRMALY